MWFLVGLERNAGLRIWLKPGTTLTVGRQNADDILNIGHGDISVGRRHATITVSKPTMQSVRTRDEHTKLTICDLSSKHGVFVNDERIEAAQNIEITIDADHTWKSQEKKHVAGRGYGGFANVAIGVETSFRLERVDWSICTQGLSAQAKLGLVEAAAEVGCKIEEAWIPGVSTHMVTTKPKRSEKLYLALAEGGYLVNVDWMKAAEKSFKESWDSKGQKDALSMEESYPAPIPVNFEHVSIQWGPNAHRRTLFSDYRFISVTAAKYQNLGQLVQCAGGSWTRADTSTALGIMSECMNATLIPVFLHPQDTDNVAMAYPKLDGVLKRMKYRWVQEDEIGMAIIYASTEKYCNPKYLDSLPTVESMASLQGSQFAASQFFGSLAEAPGTSTLIKSSLPTIHNAASPHLTGDETSSMASFSLSQIMLPSRKSNRVAPGPGAPAATDETNATPSKEKAVAEKPAKKKTKVDRMAMFFDGLEDDDIAVGQPEPMNDQPLSDDIVPSTILSPWMTSQENSNSFRLDTILPLAASAKTVEDLQSTSKGSKDTTIKDVPEQMDMQPADKSAKGHPRIPELIDPINSAADNGSGPSSQRSSSQISSANPRKKLSTFDPIREDMETLKLDIKVERQKETLDEIERLQRLEILRLQKKAKGDAHKLMQSEWSERLLAKSKRPKLSDEQDLDKSDNASTSSHISHVSSSEQDWPEHWKKMSNFKIVTKADPIMQEKWKDRPNFKTFRKSAKVGVAAAPRRPTPFTTDAALTEEQEEMAQKIGRYLSRDPQEPPIPPRRKAVNEKQMARDDLKALLADN